MFKLNLDPKSKQPTILGNIIGDADALLIADLASQYNGTLVVVTPNAKSAQALQKTLYEFCKDKVIELFPEWGTLAYDNFSPPKDIISERSAGLFKLQNNKVDIFIISVSSLMQKLSPPEFLAHNVLLIKPGDKIVIEDFKLRLSEAGYNSVNQVMQHGEFSSRGALIDLFPMGSQQPYRLDFFDDEIDSIRTFDTSSQRSLINIDEINLLPAHEFPTDKAAISLFREQFLNQFTIRPEPEHIYQQVSKHYLPAGIEYWLPLFFNQTASLFAYLPQNTLFCTYSDINEKAEKFYHDVQQRYQLRSIDPMRPLLEPKQLWSRMEEVNQELKAYPRVVLNKSQTPVNTRQKNLKFSVLPDVSIDPSDKQPLKLLEEFIQDFSGQIIFSVETEGRREILLDLLASLKLPIKQIDNIHQAKEQKYSLMLGSAEHGFIFDLYGIKQAFICETDLLGKQVKQRKYHQHKSVNPDALIRNLMELKVGQPVVHLEHGIGRYNGLVSLDVGDVMGEYLQLLYANDAKLYIPISSLHMISRYVGGADDNVTLHKLGSDAWDKTKRKAVEKIHDVAAELLDVYAQREAKIGFAFKYDIDEFQPICDSFPFEETPDQLQAINAVLEDMCKPKAMDRLICGDVGFGKTEVAIRASFLANLNHKQVAILVPTTLLAQQHYKNFQDRFANLAINVEMISRFRTAKEQKEILAKLAEGKIDILIGTHKLLQKDVKFKDLGLLIVDEEHRFGVKQKEQIKQLRANIDILTLTATPIPRTLNMALSGMRDLSIIATPPKRRLSIKTIIRQTDDYIIREAILREISRGGQIYYLHNNVASIEMTANKLAELVPEANIVIGHGQMREKDLEQVMTDFYRQRFNVLVCSTIIETGIDNPNANTMIIERADRFGLAQLHQLRGRVGRSHQQAYVYMLVPAKKLMSRDAIKRIEVLDNLDSLGAGFVLANHDLEIRGAGELLGHEQSGQIASLGFSLYMDLLAQAVEDLKAGKQPSLESLKQQQLDINLGMPALLPDNYIDDVSVRLYFYKRIASATTNEELSEIKIELIDRFGALPSAGHFLLEIAFLRLVCEGLGIQDISVNAEGGTLEFAEKANIDLDKLLNLIQQQPEVYHFAGATKLRFEAKLEDYQPRLDFVKDLVNQIKHN